MGKEQSCDKFEEAANVEEGIVYIHQIKREIPE